MSQWLSERFDQQDLEGRGRSQRGRNRCGRQWRLLHPSTGRETMNIFDRLVSLFTNENARFRIIEHTPEGRSDLVAGVRGTTIAQGAKAIVCTIPVEGREQYVLL